MALAKTVVSSTIAELSNSQFQLHLLPSSSLKLCTLKPILPSQLSKAQFTDSRRSISQRSPRRYTTMAASGSAKEESNDQLGVLFVCWGNICRSPTAEAVFRDLVEKRGLQSRFKIDSAGTIDYHEGEPADARMKAAAIKRGIKITSLSRPIRPSDFGDFDIILAMDKKNEGDIMKAHKQWSKIQKLPPSSESKVKLMCSYCKKHTEKEVPDPYYGGPEGFEKVLDLLEDACESLLDSLVPSVEQKSG